MSLRLLLSGVCATFSLIAPFMVHAGTEPNLSIGYMWGSTSVVDGGEYDFPLNTKGVGTYTWAGGWAYGDIYRGVPQNSVSVTGHSIWNSGSWTEYSDKFSEEGDYFVVIYNIPVWATSSWIFAVRDWFRSGTNINPAAHPPVNWGIIRFRVGKTGVELYTQNESNFPPRLPEDEWADKLYANGTGTLGDQPCGSTIAACGCAITSSVMVARYHGVTTTRGSDVNPFEINRWLENNDGYDWDGDISDWNKIAHYAEYKIKLAGAGTSESKLNAALDADNPVIAHASRPGHFFVIDKKISDTYGVKDPYWYSTETLNDAVVGGIDYANHLRDYDNTYDNLLFFVPHNGVAYSSIAFSLGSPAELLITDEEGRKLGKDPVSGVESEEIPNGFYSIAGYISDPTDPIAAQPDHMGKTAYITDASSGTYRVKVIGTGTGPFTLKTTFTDTEGDSTSTTYEGFMTEGRVVEYVASFNSVDVGGSVGAYPMVTLEDMRADVVLVHEKRWVHEDVYEKLIAKLETAVEKRDQDLEYTKFIAKDIVNELERRRGDGLAEEAYLILHEDAELLIAGLQ